MHQLLKQILIIVSALVLVVASGGFSLYQNYCICESETSSSVLIESAGCNDTEVAEACCSVQIEKERSSFHTEIDQIISHHPCKSKEDCCTSEVTFLKTDNFNFSVDEKKSFQFITAFVIVLESNTFQKEQYFIEELSYTADLPPPDYGKKLLVTLHQFKIASPLV